MTKALGEAAQYHGAIKEIGRLAEEQNLPGAVDALQRLQQMENRQDLGFFPAFGHVRDVLALSEAETVLLAVCTGRYMQLRALPKPEDLYELYLKLGGSREGELSFTLNPAGELLPLALDFILGRSPKLPPWAELRLPGNEPVFHGGAMLDELETAAAAAVDAAAPTAIALTGAKGSGKAFAVAQVAQRLGCAVLFADPSRMEEEDIPWLCAAASVWGALLCFRDWKGQKKLVSLALQRVGLVFLTGTCVAGLSGNFGLIERKMQPMTPQERLSAMALLFQDIVSPEVLQRTAGFYRLNAGSLMALSARIRGEALTGTVTESGFLEALRVENAPSLSQNAQLLVTGKSFDDLVLPPVQMEQLVAIRDFVMARDTVYRSWGFDQKISYGKGISALFYGASGTGKTMAASALANELGLELYRVDLSQLVSKYIGETQKNIGKIFDDAQSGDCILFFDEADALFSRRTDGGDSQDKYVNSEIAYLLQRTESYDGVMILATNLLQNFDEAFRRRISYMLHFPLPDAALREKLWRGIFPDKAPLEALDFGLLANELELSGAGIRNIALCAAYMAATRDGKIDTACCVRAARLEYSKQGKAFPHRLDGIFPQERSL